MRVASFRVRTPPFAFANLLKVVALVRLTDAVYPTRRCCYRPNGIVLVALVRV
jgi:hypothetical protein